MRLRDITIVCAALGIAGTSPVTARQVAVQTNVQANNQTGLPPAAAKKIPANSIAAVADKLNWEKVVEITKASFLNAWNLANEKSY